MPWPIQMQVVDAKANLPQKKKKQNRLSGKSYRLHHVHNHPVHAKHRSAANRSKDVMQETWNQDWTDWLELISQQDLYVRNI